MIRSRSLALSLVVPLAAATLLTSVNIATANEVMPQSAPASSVTITAGSAPKVPTFVAAKKESRSADRQSSARLQAATFQVTYSGFTPEAQAAFQRAVDYWAARLNTTVPVTINASFAPLGSGVLGSAGASSVWQNFAGAERTNTYYVDAIANKQAGRQLDSSPDINAQFSSNFTNWHFGTSAAPAGMYDFTSVVLHEIGHGLGFLGAGKVTSNTGTVRLNGVPISYDHYTENGAGTSLLSYANNSSALGSQLRSNNLYFDSPQVRAANGNAAAKIYAPATWQQGSSYSHLDESTYIAGNVNSLMTPQIGAGETIRDAGALAFAIYDTIGW